MTSRAAACVVITLARPDRLPGDAAYVTSPGDRVVSVVTDLGVLRRVDGELKVAAVAPGDAPIVERVRALVGACGWEPAVVRNPEELDAVSAPEVLALREYDRERLFLR